uniref:CSON000029 protein n=2 Tax=Culicoides sonorensis TaxID=179676 RepID=A0A336MHK1_CULSO
MKFLILFAVIAAASAVPYYPWSYEGYEKYPMTGYYGKDYYSDKYDYKTLMMGGSKTFLDKDITMVKKDFIVFYYKYLVDLLDIFKTRFNDILASYDFKKFDTYQMPAYCGKMTGLMRWMMVMNIDFTKYDPYYFDLFMMCKVSDYTMFMKYYWLNFNFVDVMHKDYPFMKDMYQIISPEYLYKFGEYYGKGFGGFGDKYYGKDFVGDKYYGKDFVGDKYYGKDFVGDKYYGKDFVGDKYYGFEGTFPEKYGYDYGYLFSKFWPSKDYYYRY